MKMDNLVEINIERLRYLLRLYNLSEDELLSMLNKERKRELQKDDVFTDRIRLSLLKQIDAVFNKGLFYYIDFSPVSVDGQNSISQGLSEVEKWCNDFAFYFLMGDSIAMLDSLPYANSNNDYATDTVKALSTQTHVSLLAIFTRLVIEKKMTPEDYNLVRGGILNSIKQSAAERKKQLKESSAHIQSPRPIISNLFRDTLQCALYRGVINEAEFCRQLNVKPEKIDYYLQ